MRRATSSLRLSMIRSLVEAELAGSTLCGASDMTSSIQQPLLSLRTFSAQTSQGVAAFSTSSFLPRAAEAAAAAAQEHEPEEQQPDANHLDEPLFPDVVLRLDERITEAYKVDPSPVFAVVEVGGTQYKVTPDDLIVTEKLDGVDVNDKIKLQRVLMLGSAAETVIGRPYIPDASVIAVVEEQFLDGKVIIFHKRRRKNSRRTKGHRQPLTTLRIVAVEGIEPASEPSEAVVA